MVDEVEVEDNGDDDSVVDVDDDSTGVVVDSEDGVLGDRRRYRSIPPPFDEAKRKMNG